MLSCSKESNFVTSVVYACALRLRVCGGEGRGAKDCGTGGGTYEGLRCTG